VRHRVAVEQHSRRLLDVVALLHGDVLALGDQVLDRLLILVLGHHDDAALVLVVLAELDAAGDLADDRVVLRLARLEQLRHPRQTAGDVAGLGAFRGNAREHVAGLDLGPLSTDRIASTDRSSGPRRRAAASPPRLVDRAG
jgi:hypothetical protein